MRNGHSFGDPPVDRKSKATATAAAVAGAVAVDVAVAWAMRAHHGAFLANLAAILGHLEIMLAG